MSEHFFSINPGEELFNFLDFCKKETFHCIGDQKYLRDKPHLTLYVGNFFCSINLYLEIKEQFLKTQPFDIQITNWKTFYHDPITGGHTLALAVSKESQEKLTQLQLEIVSIAKKFRTVEIIPRYSNTESFTVDMIESLKKFGFPFVGRIWQAHFTIASIKVEDYPMVWNRLKNEKFPTTTNISSVSLNEIHDQNIKAIFEWQI